MSWLRDCSSTQISCLSLLDGFSFMDVVIDVADNGATCYDHVFCDKGAVTHACPALTAKAMKRLAK